MSQVDRGDEGYYECQVQKLISPMRTSENDLWCFPGVRPPNVESWCRSLGGLGSRGDHPRPSCPRQAWPQHYTQLQGWGKWGLFYMGLPGWERPTSPNYWVEERWSHLHGHRGWPRWAVFDRRTLHKTMSLKGRRRWRMVSPLQPPALSLRHRSHSQCFAGKSWTKLAQK